MQGLGGRRVIFHFIVDRTFAGEVERKLAVAKRVLFLKTKYDNNEMLTPTDLADLKRFKQLLK